MIIYLELHEAKSRTTPNSSFHPQLRKQSRPLRSRSTLTYYLHTFLLSPTYPPLLVFSLHPLKTLFPLREFDLLIQRPETRFRGLRLTRLSTVAVVAVEVVGEEGEEAQECQACEDEDDNKVVRSRTEHLVGVG